MSNVTLIVSLLALGATIFFGVFTSFFPFLLIKIETWLSRQYDDFAILLRFSRLPCSI